MWATRTIWTQAEASVSCRSLTLPHLCPLTPAGPGTFPATPIEVALAPCKDMAQPLPHSCPASTCEGSPSVSGPSGWVGGLLPDPQGLGLSEGSLHAFPQL